MARKGVSCFFILAVLMTAELCLAKEYLVKEGDSISTILGRFAPSEADLKEANPQKHDWPNLHVGEKLEVPHLSLVEARALEARLGATQNELSAAHESIVALTEARDLARSESDTWQSKFEAAEPVATSAWFWRKWSFVLLAVSIVLGGLLAFASFIAVNARKRLGARIEALEGQVTILEGDPDGWRRIYAKAQEYLAKLSQLKAKDRAELLDLFTKIQLLPTREMSDAITSFVSERVRVVREAPVRQPLVAVPPKK